MKASFSRFFLLFAVLAAAAPLMGQSLAEIQQRMRERLPAIDTLKLQGALGENNQGYLEARAEITTEQTRMVAEENADRRQLYQVAARRANVSLAEVERSRAKQIRDRSPEGIWLQDDEGNWYRK